MEQGTTKSDLRQVENTNTKIRDLLKQAKNDRNGRTDVKFLMKVLKMLKNCETTTGRINNTTGVRLNSKAE